MAPFRWDELNTQVAVVVATIFLSTMVGGMGYLAFTVPKQLQQVLVNQSEIMRVKEKQEGHHDRIIRLETLHGIMPR